MIQRIYNIQRIGLLYVVGSHCLLSQRNYMRQLVNWSARPAIYCIQCSAWVHCTCTQTCPLCQIPMSFRSIQRFSFSLHKNC